MARRKESGFTLIEIIIVVVLVILFLLVAVDHLLPLRAAAERAHVQQVEGSLRSALGMQATRRVLDEGRRGLARLENENPLDWLQVGPPTSDVDALADIPAGHWAWLQRGRQLVYRLRYPEYVEGAFDGEWLRYRVHYSEVPAGLTMQALDSPDWALPDMSGSLTGQ